MTASTQLLKANSRELHDRIIAACRELMIDGNVRPSISDIADKASCSRRSVHDHFDTLQGIHRIALQDEATVDAVWLAIWHKGQGWPEPERSRRIARAVVLGKVGR